MNEIMAAEVAVFQSLSELKLMFERFGPFSGRYLAAFPKDRWRRDLYDHISRTIPEPQASAAKLLVRRAVEGLKIVRPAGRAYSSDLDWFGNVVAIQRSKDPFDTVIVTGQHRHAGLDLKSLRICEIDECEFAPTTGARFPGVVAAYARAASVLLKESARIYLVDRYLCPADERHRVVLSELLTISAAGRCECVTMVVRDGEFNRRRSESLEVLRRLADESGFSGRRRLNLRIFRQSDFGGILHDRHLVTEFGGVRFENGCQEVPRSQAVSLEPIAARLHTELFEFLRSTDHESESLENHWFP